MTKLSSRAPARAYRCRLQLRWSDQLLHHHLDHVRILTLLEEARVRAGRVWSGTTPDGGGDGGENRVVRTMSTEYLRELTYRDDDDDVLEARVWIGRIGTTSYTVCHELVQDGRVGVYAEAVIVKLSKGNGKPTALTEELRRELLRFQHPDA